MKANELQADDYLSYNGQVIKVESITKKKVGYHLKPNECRLHYARLCECKPIPLAPEILEKNGFTNNPYFEGIYIKEINKRCQITYDVDTPCLMINFRGGYVSKKAIKYLHELQHALRFIGLSGIADNLIL